MLLLLFVIAGMLDGECSRQILQHLVVDLVRQLFFLNDLFDRFGGSRRDDRLALRTFSSSFSLLRIAPILFLLFAFDSVPK
jgi:hypothetical protein